MKTLEELEELSENIDTLILIKKKERQLNNLRIEVAELENDIKILNEGEKLNEEELEEFDYTHR